jgi:hypothetical protein
MQARDQKGDTMQPTEKELTQARFWRSLVIEPQSLGRTMRENIKARHEPELQFANMVAAAMKQPSRFFRVLMASYVGCGDEHCEAFIAWAMKDPNRIGQEVMLRYLWNCMWHVRSKLPVDDWQDVLGFEPDLWN